jgi:tetratricopeptide (TPR) repeat protein
VSAAAAIEAALRQAAAGRPAQAGRALEALAARPLADPSLRAALCRALYRVRRFEAAAAVARNAQDLASMSGLAASLVALGELGEAERVFDAIVRLWPADGAAWANRATLRRWTVAENHVPALRRALAGADAGPGDAGAAIALAYGLAKELEDLGVFEESFAHLARGAALRRARLSYAVEIDVTMMAEIARRFDAGAMARAPAARNDEPGPIFVMGLPRSGTTLVDRILSSHSSVESLGELPDVAMALVETTPPRRDRLAFVAAAAEADPAPLRARILQRLAGYEPQRPLALDKTPVNFLYVGLIARALPEARIVHVRREAMDVGYALYKTLFQTGCPYAYDLVDIARYIGAYRRLMAHWRAVLPGRVIEIDYEALVADLPGEARRLVAACGLGWEDACESFHLNRQPSSTASAAQVRRPLYRDSVGLWRRYEAQLEPLRLALDREGVP